MNDVLEDLVHILRIRSVLAYRHDENTNKSPKARNVILGYLDDDHENRPAALPTVTRNTGQLLLQFGSWTGYSAAKGYVSGAFVPVRSQTPTRSWVPTVRKLAAALNVTPGVTMKLKKAPYGPVEAPVEWYISMSSVLEEGGWRRLKSDPLLFDID